MLMDATSQEIGPDHPAAAAVQEVLLQQFHQDPNEVRRCFEDPRVRVRGVADPGSGQLLAFVLFEELDQWMRGSPYGSMFPELMALLPASNLQAFVFYLSWWKEGGSAEEWISTILHGFESELAQDADKVVLVSHSSTGADWDRMHRLLERLGFRRHPSVFITIEWPLPKLLPRRGKARFGEVLVRPMSDGPVSMASLARCYDRAFFRGKHGVDAEEMQRLCEDLGVCSEISIIGTLGDSDQVVGFLLAQRHAQEDLMAEVHLVGMDPDFQRRGLVLRSMPLLLAACSRAGVRTLRLTINQGNSPIRGLVQKHLGARELRRCIAHFRVSQGGGDLSLGVEETVP